MVPKLLHAAFGTSHPAARVLEHGSFCLHGSCCTLASQPIRLFGNELVKTNMSLLALEAGKC